jgi:hypothetical protein
MIEYIDLEDIGIDNKTIDYTGSSRGKLIIVIIRQEV